MYDLYLFTTTTLGHLAKTGKGQKRDLRGLGLSAFMRVSGWLLVASSKQIEHKCSRSVSNHDLNWFLFCDCCSNTPCKKVCEEALIRDEGHVLESYATRKS